MMVISRIDVSDIEQIKKIHAKLGFEWVEPCLHIGTIKCSIDGNIVGAGFLRPIVEAVMILDPDSPDRVKAKALHEMMSQAVSDTKDAKLNEIHAWVKEPSFEEVLRNHYLFEVPRGQSLVLRL